MRIIIVMMHVIMNIIVIMHTIVVMHIVKNSFDYIHAVYYYEYVVVDRIPVMMHIDAYAYSIMHSIMNDVVVMHIMVMLHIDAYSVNCFTVHIIMPNIVTMHITDMMHINAYYDY